MADQSYLDKIKYDLGINSIGGSFTVSLDGTLGSLDFGAAYRNGQLEPIIGFRPEMPTPTTYMDMMEMM